MAEGLYDAASNAAVGILSAALAYTVAVWRKPSHKQMADAIAPLLDRIVRLETKTDQHVTRSEFRESMGDVKSLLADVREDIRAIRQGYK